MRRSKRWLAISISAVLAASLGVTPVLAEPADDMTAVSDAESTSAADSTQPEEFTRPEESVSETPSGDADALVSENETADSVRAEGAPEPEMEELDLELLSADGVELTLNVTDLGSLSLQYDDRYDLSNQGVSAASYIICMDEEGQEAITSYQVEKGETSTDKDASLLAWTTDRGAEVAACGVGEGTVYFVPADNLDTLKEWKQAQGDAEESGAEDTDNTESDGEIIEVYKLTVTVKAAPLTLMFLAGQSNMEGYCDSSTGYQPEKSIACTDGTVYSTYVPSSQTKGYEVTGISSISDSTDGRTTAGSLQGAVTDGVLADPLNQSGGALSYPLNSLTASGGGKTGPDSGLAYEWHALTGDKVWVVNTGYGSTAISKWMPQGTCYTRSKSIWEQVLQTYQAEVCAGHYTDGSVSGNKLVFWLQGESDDSSSAEQYESSFSDMYAAMCTDLGQSEIPFGIIMVRAGNSGSAARTSTDLAMTGPRIAQYFLGGASSDYSHVFVVSNANEQWVSDSGVKSYFSGKCGYSTQNGSISAPTTVNAVHYDKHYSQIGHNENGITAADGMYQALKGAKATGVSWRDADGQTISKAVVDYSATGTVAVPVVDPVYAAKSVTYSWGSGIAYDAASAAVTGKSAGTYKITPSCGSALSATVVAKGETGVCKYNGTWYYLINGIIQWDYTGVADYKNDAGWWYIKDGVLDRSYTGFSKNKNGSWYVHSGKVTKEDYTVLKDTTGAIGAKNEWYYVIGGKVQYSFTGLANYKNSSGWWYITGGRVDRSVNTVAKNKNGWYYVVNGKVQKSFTGLANYRNKSGWWYIKKGKVDRSYHGVATNKNGRWYLKNGKVQQSYTGTVKVNGKTYRVTNGKVK